MRPVFKRSSSPVMTTAALALTCLLATLMASTGCVRSYATRPALEFKDLTYASVEVKPWPTKSVALKMVNLTHGLPEGTQVTYVELNPEGERTLVFIHGLGSYLKFWQLQLNYFAGLGYRVIALDMLGYGKSDKPAMFPYTTEAMAEVVRELVATLAIHKPTLVGHSMGGQIAMAYAIRWPEALSALVLTSPAGFESFSVREEAWFASAFTTSLVKGNSEEGIWGAIARSNFARWRDAYEWLIEERVRLAQSKDFDAYAYANVRSVQGLAHNGFVRDNLDQVKAPTIIVYGDEDRLIPNPFLHGGNTSTIMEFGRDHIAKSQLVELVGCGHTVQMDCAPQYNDVVSGFLKVALK